jgi:hypothetical protein
MLSDTQKRFILMFVEDGDFNFGVTCNRLGIRQSEAMRWFNDSEFQDAKEKAHQMLLRRMGYGQLLAMQDTLAVAHSDITQILGITDDGMKIQDLEALPRRLRVAIKSIECGVAFTVDAKGEPKTVVYPKKITMHDKLAALAKVSEWFDVAGSEAAKGKAASEDGPKRISGLVVRPPITEDEAEGEKLLEG